MKITKEYRFEAAHRLMDHPGACRYLHGHSYKLEVTVKGPINPDGMVVDFGVLSDAVKNILNMSSDHHTAFDHATILKDTDPLVDWLLKGIQDKKIPNMRIISLPSHPTAEFMAGHFAVLVQGKLDEFCENYTPGDWLRVVRVRLWETAKAHATWEI